MEVFMMIDGLIEPSVYPGNYYISNYGRVWSKHINRMMAISLDHNGYCVVNLRTYSGKPKICKIHRLVAKAFIPIANPDELQVNHKDGIKTHNYVSNLEWTTSKENIVHSIETGLRNTFGENVHTAVLKEEQVYIASEMLMRKYPYDAILQHMGLPKNQQTYKLLFRIHKKETWLSITKNYNFPEYDTAFHNQIFTYDELHQICNYLVQNGIQSSTYDIMNHIGKGEIFKCLDYSDKKKYYGAITKIKSKRMFKNICNQYDY